MPPPCPSPVNGGGDAGAAGSLIAATRLTAASFAAMARAGMLACNDYNGFAVIVHGPHCHYRADAVRGGAGAGAAIRHDRARACSDGAAGLLEERPSPQPSQSKSDLSDFGR